jgi:hypothetical protein
LGSAVFLWVDVVQMLRQPPRIASPQPDAIEWGDRVFGSPSEFRRWLHSRGASYSHWRTRFPAEARVLEHRPPLRATSTPITSATPKTTTVTKRAKPAAAKVTAERSAAPSARVAKGDGARRRGLMLWFLVVAAVGALIVIAERAQSHRPLDKEP